jgi:hypothetical protein
MWRDWARAHRVFFLVAALVGVIAGAVLNIRANDRASDSAAMAAPERVDVPPTTEALSADDVTDAIEVVESGFTVGDAQTCQIVADPCPPESVTVSHLVTYGVVIENTSDQVLRWIPVTVTFSDRRRERVAPAGGEPQQQGITRLAPGERTGIGATWELAAGEAAGIRVEVDHPRRWMSPAYEADVRPTGPLRPTVTDAKVTSSAPEPGTSAHASVRYEAHLGYEHYAGKHRVEDEETLYGSFQASGRPSVILRNEQGDIVGGVRGPSTEVRESDSFEVDLTLESRTFPAFSSASAEVYFNEISFREVMDVD